MLASLDRQEANKWNLHAGQCSQSIPGGVADVEASAVPAHGDQDQRMHRQQAGNESVSTPRGHHVSVEERAESSPQHGAQLQGLDPQVKGKDKKEDGNSLVIVAAGDGSGDVTRRNSHEDGSQETGRWRRSHFIGEEISGKRSQA